MPVAETDEQNEQGLGGIEVDVPELGTVHFPEGTSQDKIRDAIRKHRARSAMSAAIMPPDKAPEYSTAPLTTAPLALAGGPATQPAPRAAERIPAWFAARFADLPPEYKRMPTDQEVAEHEQEMAQRQQEVQSLETAQNPITGAAAGLGRVSAAIPAALADITETDITKPRFENVRAALLGQPQPIRATMENIKSPTISFPYKVATQTLETVPKLAGVAAAESLGVPPTVAAGAIFGFEEDGSWNPKQAAIATALPFAGKWGGKIAETVGSRLKITNPAALDLVNAGGRYATANAILTAQTAAGADWDKMTDDQKQNAVAGIIVNALLGLADFQPKGRGGPPGGGRLNLDAASQVFKQAAEKARQGIAPIEARIAARQPGEPNAPQERKVEGGVQPERVGTDAQRLPTEAGAGNRVQPETPVVGTPQPKEAGTPGTPPEPVRDALTPPTIEGVRFDKLSPKVGDRQNWQFTVQDNGPAHNAGFSVPVGSSPDVIRAKVAELVKARTAPEPDWQVTVQGPQGEMPGYVSIDDRSASKRGTETGDLGTEAKAPPTVESLRAYGHEVPDFSKLPPGKYTWEQAVKMANESAPTESTTGPVTFDPNDVPTSETPVADIKLSKDVPNFKKGADPETGIVPGQELKGPYRRIGTAPIIVWRRLNGDLEVITGRHRFELAKRTGEKTIPTQIVDEAKGYTKEMALREDAEGNIRDNQGTLEDYVQYFKNSPDITEADAGKRGLLRNAAGRSGFKIGRQGSDDLQAAWHAGKINDSQATAIADTAPDNPNAQQIGIRAALEGDKADAIRTRMEAAQNAAKTTGKASQSDFFANTEMDEVWKKQGAVIAAKRKELNDIISTRKAIINKYAAATGTGSIKATLEAAKAELAQAQAELDRWSRWADYPDLVEQVTGQKAKPAEVTPKPTLTLDQPETVDEQNARLERERKAAEDKANAEAAAEAVRQKQTGGIGGNLGSAGQGGLFEEPGQGEMFKPSPPKPPTDVGPPMGADVLGANAPSPQTPTGIKNATVDQERAKRGLPPAMQPARRSFGEVWDAAMARIDREPDWLDGGRGKKGLLQELREKPRALTDIEDAALLHRQVDLHNEYGKATRDLAQAHEDGRAEAVEEEKLRVAGLSDQLLDLYNIEKTAGTETGRGLNARKMMAYEDFTLAKMELDKRAANGGRPLTDAERAELTAAHDKLQALQKAYDEHVEKSAARAAELEIQKQIAEAKAAAAPSFHPKIVEAAEKIVKGFETRADAARARLKGKLLSLSPQDLADIAEIGAAHLARGVLDSAKWTAKMVGELGDQIRPYLEQARAASEKRLDEMLASAPAAVKKAIRAKATTAERRDAAISNIADKVAKGKRNDIAGQVQKMARSFVEDGIADREKLIDAVHAELAKVMPGISRRETMDAISGYGDFKQLSKDQISIQLRAMKGEMQQLAKLEDMAMGKPPLKTGIERRTPSEDERKLIKRVNDAKNKFQVPVSDPSRQLKSSLDTLKTTLTNRIADYEERLRTGDFAPRARRQLTLDNEALGLKAQTERLKQDIRKKVALDRQKNRTPLEKTQDALVKWRRGFLLSGVKTLGKLIAAAAQRMVITPAEQAAGVGISKAFPRFAERTKYESASIKAEAKALTEGITKGMADAWQTLKTGQSDLDILYGKQRLLPPEAIDFFGHSHGALKSVTKRNEFARRLQLGIEWSMRNGIDVSDPFVQIQLGREAYEYANRSIFMQDNRVVSAYKRALSALEQKNKATGKPTTLGRAGATAMRVALPIVKVPTNIVAETMQYSTGAVTGSFRLAQAYRRGIESLKPEEADLIMRQLKKGSLGGAAMLLGYFAAPVIGGYYQSGEKRKAGEPKAGHIQLFGHDIPTWLLHNPLLETLQIGATIRRVADSKLKKSDPNNQGITAGIIAGAVGLTEEVPFVRETLELLKAFNPHQRGEFAGELGRSLAVPQLVQEIAQATDRDEEGNLIKRKPKTALERIKVGVPGLRQQVREAPYAEQVH